MGLTRRDREFRLPKITYIDFKQLEMDRVLTRFFERLAHNGYPGRLNLKGEVRTQQVIDEFLAHPEWFIGFSDHPDVLKRWLETHLLDLVNRGKPNQAIAAPRPLHGYTFRFRNARHSRDYGAAQHLYEVLFHTRKSGQYALEHLKNFFFQGHDKVTGQADTSATLDVETQALLRLMEQVRDVADTRQQRHSVPPLCVGSADLLAEDIMRLLFYQRFIPRSVMVDYLKTLLSFHLALYHLRLLKLLPALVRRKGSDPTCAPTECPMNPRSASDPHGDCPYRIALLVDVAAQPDTPMASLAERSADVHYRRIPSFIRAHFAAKKLDEFAHHLVKLGKLHKKHGQPFTADEVLRLLEPGMKGEREKFFGARVASLVQNSAGSTQELDPEIQGVIDLGLDDDFETYIEMLASVRGSFHRKYVTQFLDSVLLKHRPGALLAQSRTKGAPRRFVLDSRLLEVLLQIAVLRPDPAGGFFTGEMRVDALLTWLRERYGIFVEQMPKTDGFSSPSIAERKALRDNSRAFTDRLREIGFYRDLSDAYVSQTVTPRYSIQPKGTSTGGNP